MENSNFPTEFKAPEKIVALKNLAIQAFEKSGNIVIKNDDDYELAAEILKGYKKQAKELLAERKKQTDPLDQSKKAIMAFFKKPSDFLDMAEKKLKASMLDYQQKVEQRRKEKEEEARRAADRERKYQEDLARKRLETAKKKGDSDRIEQINDEIEEIKNESVVFAPVVETPKASGISTREIWSAKIVDKMALIKAVADGKAPATLLDVNTTIANQLARSMKKDLSIPGIEAVSNNIIAA